MSLLNFVSGCVCVVKEVDWMKYYVSLLTSLCILFVTVVIVEEGAASEPEGEELQVMIDTEEGGVTGASPVSEGGYTHTHTHTQTRS